MADLLGQALGAIGTQKVLWHRFSARKQNARGEWKAKYHTPLEVFGSMQPVSADRAKMLGYDETRKLWTLFCREPVAGIERGRSSDQIEYNGRMMSVLSVSDWYGYDGWVSLLLIEVD